MNFRAWSETTRITLVTSGCIHSVTPSRRKCNHDVDENGFGEKMPSPEKFA